MSTLAIWCRVVRSRDFSAPSPPPEHIRSGPDIRVFRKLLKTHLFNQLLTYTDILFFIRALGMHLLLGALDEDDADES